MTLAQGRSTRLPRTRRRRQLLDAAQQVFVARGYHATAMDDIAERAGVSKPVLYQHFPGKFELYLALLDTHGDALVSTVREAMASTADNHERVQRAMEAYFDFVDAQGEAFRLVFESDLRNDPIVAERVDRVERDCGIAIAETIMGDTGVDRERAELLAIGLTGAAEMAARRWLATKRAVPKAEAVGLLATLAWRGISRFPLADGGTASDEGDRDGGVALGPSGARHARRPASPLRTTIGPVSWSAARGRRSIAVRVGRSRRTARSNESH